MILVGEELTLFLATDQFSVARPLGPEDWIGMSQGMAFTPHSWPQLEFHGVST